ncbi:MAG: hypothetical protein NTY98_05550, partial [Verrucomicrobia bacterium]|nr:hypothetical protein [Verrucomicrobiota bacterium]
MPLRRIRHRRQDVNIVQVLRRIPHQTALICHRQTFSYQEISMQHSKKPLVVALSAAFALTGVNAF